MNTFKFVLWIVAAGAFWGCPVYEDSQSGTFREVVDPAYPPEEVLGLELIRFGDHVQTITRFFPWTAQVDQQFQNQSRCMWSEAGDFHDEERFDLRLDSVFGGDPLRVRGRLEEDAEGETNRLQLRIESAEQFRELVLERTDEEPSTDCDQIKPIVVRGYFGDGKLESEHRLSAPVMSLFWVGLASVRSSLVGITSVSGSVRLEAQRHITADRQSLRNWEVLWATPPREAFLMRSGDTRFAIAYIVVIDDRDDSGAFLWQSAEEPIVASSLQTVSSDGSRVWEGKAVLYVEGDLRELGQDLSRILRGVESADPLDHFYIVDLKTNAREEITELLLPENRTQNAVPVIVSDDRLQDRASDFPRFWHLWSPEQE